MSDGKEVMRVWISFGEHGDCTNEQDWEVDEPALAKRFDDKFYTYYAFRKMENGVDFVLASDHDRKTNEYEVLLNRKFEQLCEKDSVIAELRAEVAKAETTIARQEEAIENIRQQVRAMHFDIELASIERAEGDGE